ncbi:hypothetical protein BESB_012270 [Besnoitia besnoiti]|uniref:Uncharacterized protein n=1 Tax=Besnoitia besnoiti TaxID=94643 RepID=A0A2A9M3T4_BESBE|nr:hypothetical protein BESB_012270 [Besnoitia besnoiti]PFH32615.1 hypothetical protein BESB_012270 [Besnoitia besnoiti]
MSRTTMLTVRPQPRVPGPLDSKASSIHFASHYQGIMPRLLRETKRGRDRALKQKAGQVLPEGLHSETSTEDSLGSPTAFEVRSNRGPQAAGTHKRCHTGVRMRRESSSSWNSDRTPVQASDERNTAISRLNGKCEPLLKIKDALQTTRLRKRLGRGDIAVGSASAESFNEGRFYHCAMLEADRQNMKRCIQKQVMLGLGLNDETCCDNRRPLSTAASCQQQRWLVTPRQAQSLQESIEDAHTASRLSATTRLNRAAGYRRSRDRWTQVQELPSTTSELIASQGRTYTFAQKSAEVEAGRLCAKRSSGPSPQATSGARPCANRRVVPVAEQKQIVLQMQLVSDVVHEAAALRFGWAIHRIVRRHLIRVISHLRKATTSYPPTEQPLLGCTPENNVYAYGRLSLGVSGRTGESHSDWRRYWPRDRMALAGSDEWNCSSCQDRNVYSNGGIRKTVGDTLAPHLGASLQRRQKPACTVGSHRDLGARVLSRALRRALHKESLGEAWERLKVWSQDCQFGERIGALYLSLENVSAWAALFSRVMAVTALWRVICCSARKWLLRAFLTMLPANSVPLIPHQSSRRQKALLKPLSGPTISVSEESRKEPPHMSNFLRQKDDFFAGSMFLMKFWGELLALSVSTRQQSYQQSKMLLSKKAGTTHWDT